MKNSTHSGPKTSYFDARRSNFELFFKKFHIGFFLKNVNEDLTQKSALRKQPNRKIEHFLNNQNPPPEANKKSSPHLTVQAADTSFG
ncbi:MAG: hypothetical protein II200_02560 [Bacteroidaceae bacterium]|nr:hypothetical protein [Bacteroidaceae bacterium]